MPPAEITEQQLVDQLLEALRGMPDVQAQLASPPLSDNRPDRGYDAQVDLRVAGRDVTLLIEAKKAVYPRDARQAMWQLREFGRNSSNALPGQQTTSFLIAESISPGAKELLRHERVGYYDSGGSLFLPATGVYLYVDKPTPKPLSKSLRSLFSGRRAQVLHALLIGHTEWFGVKEIAQKARVSSATASQVMTELERFEWVVSRGQGPGKERHLREPAALLDSWVKQLVLMRVPAMRRYFVPLVRAEDLVQKIAQVFAAHGAEYAITHEAAGQHYAPFLSNISQVRCRLLVGSVANQAISGLSARSVNEGANLAIIDAKSPGELLFREQVGNVWMASPIQVYLDLMRSEGRAREMAEHLRRDRIGF